MGERERERLSLSAFLGTEDIGVHSEGWLRMKLLCYGNLKQPIWCHLVAYGRGVNGRVDNSLARRDNNLESSLMGLHHDDARL